LRVSLRVEQEAGFILLMEREHFEKLVKEGVASIQEKFLGKLDNVAIVIEDEPTAEQRRKLKLRSGWTLFGLYEGIPRTARGSGYFGVLPDKITIFMHPMVEAARNEDEVREMARDTVWHEIAHHFGMDEGRVRITEAKKKKKSR
jgi:predicted Zn-dependent protease with MMP-like domain